ncbi:hypothetical protein [Nesterenkonia muleiensis]|uniref:hypothetical protein n=1 Tax=Nesterenkonia muleiensis TaxID=2282648 RepID=UPI000E76DC88|nr:hypothetical protein [Nesterenkonia muleiensis]
MDNAQPHAPLHTAGPLDDGRHTSDVYSTGIRQGRMVRLRRGVYLPADLWLTSRPSERYLFTIAAAGLQHPSSVFCRETSFAIHGLPLLALPQQVHIRANSRSAARRTRQSSLTGTLSAAEFLTRARRAGMIDHDAEYSPVLLRGFGSARHLPLSVRESAETHSLALPVPESLQTARPCVEVNVEPLDCAVAGTIPRLPFGCAIVALDAALRGAAERPSLDPQHLYGIAEHSVRSKRRLRYFQHLLSFASPLPESAGESLARVRFYELGFSQPQLQVTLTVDGSSYRLDFEWEGTGVVGEFDGWMKYRQDNRGFDEARQQEKIREDAIRSTGRTVIRFYWEDLMEPGRRRLASLLTRAGVPRLS